MEARLKCGKFGEKTVKTSADSTAEKFEKGWKRMKTVETTEYNQKQSIQWILKKPENQ